MAPPSSNEQPGAFGALETREPLTDARIDAIARELLAQLSLEEKIDMMSGGHRFFPGMLHFGSAGYKRHPVTTVGAVPRLGIPGLRFTDGPRGVMLAGATTFPAASARGASWDPHLEERVGDVMGREARAHCANMIGGPASTCCVIRPGAGRRKPMTRTATTWARWARRSRAASSAM